MTSPVDIANRALTKLGAARIISFDDNDKQARAVKSMFDIVRDAELRDHIWSFTIKRASLPALSTAPDWGYELQFNLPADFLRLLQVDEFYVGPDTTDYRNAPTAEYAIEGNKILTNIGAPLKIKYSARVSDTTRWDSSFIEAFACRLALELCEDLTQSNTKKESAREDYKYAISRAIRANSIEKPPVDLPDDAWVLSRI